METIRVNMTPCEDVQTIHASQNDNEAREWGFELHNNGEKIDSSSISDQMVFKTYEGGTEQILPENGSTPTTSPFKGDIKYPQGLLVDQEFTYRQSPTESDGLAKIQTIYGNTLKWNQLFNISNPAKGVNTSNYQVNGSSFSFRTTSATNNYVGNIALTQNHKYYICATNKASVNLRLDRYIPYSALTQLNANSSYANIVDIGSSKGIIIFSNSSDVDIVIENFMIVDLSLMYGIGNEPTSVSDFTSLFSLPYYAYNQGTLLSFMGNGIKTVGKNLWKYTDDVNKRNCTLNNQDGTITVSATGVDCYFGDAVATGLNYSAEMGWLIDVSGINNIAINTGNPLFLKNYITRYDANRVSLGFQRFNSKVFTVDVSNCTYVSLRFGYENSVSGRDYTIKPQVEIGTQSTDFEPYTSSTLSLPISTYFPNGMDGVGTDYDELTESKAYHRTTRVDLGSLEWTYLNDGIFRTSAFPNVKKDYIPKWLTTADYTVASTTNYAGWKTRNMQMGFLEGYQFIIFMNTSFTDATAFKESLNGVYLVYPLATPIETSFTTASLVTENTEIPLFNEDGVLIGKCTEQLSAEPGFHDAKIKLADEDGECYSNKIQLHVERSPQ